MYTGHIAQCKLQCINCTTTMHCTTTKHQHQHQQNGSIVQNVDSEGQALAVHPSAKWVNCTECWFWRHTHFNKSCHQKGQKQQMERQVSTIHINKFVDLPDGSTVQIVASGPLLTFLVIQKQQNGSRVLYGSKQSFDQLISELSCMDAHTKDDRISLESLFDQHNRNSTE